MSVRKTTKEDFLKFQERCKYWSGYYGFLGWSYFFKWINLKTKDAETVLDYENRQVMFTLDKGAVDYDLDDLAFHEVTEALLIGRLRWMALDRNARECDVKEEAHRIVQILSNVRKKDNQWELVV
jgi:hypothetical protein